MPDMVFLAFLVVDGALAGAIYALVALAFVVVYKASRMINFAMGEWIMLGSRMVAAGMHAFGLGLGGALGFGCVGMVAVAMAFNRVVLRRLFSRSLLSLIMVTIGLGIFMRGSAALVFAGVPGGIARTGLALRAIASDQQVAMAVGIDLQRPFAITLALVGVLSVLSGTLWSFASGGGFGLELLGLKVFPIVIVGGLDSLPGTIVGAFAVGILESLTAGYVDPLVGGGFSHVASYVVLIATLFVRPYGLFGRPDIERV